MNNLKGLIVFTLLIFATNVSALAINFSNTNDGFASFTLSSEGINYTFSNPSADTTFSISNNELLFGNRNGANAVDMTSFNLTVDMNTVLNSYAVGNNATANGGSFSIVGGSTNVSGLDGSPGFTPTSVDITPNILLSAGQTYTFSYTPNNGTSITGLSGFDATPSAVPVPAAVWLLGSALIGLSRFRRKG